ncbi:4'-phosphopantetheinyl transferase superfamily protein [Roseibium sp. CAU 1637]|uniref:4'-phosphopantetheinyl transferase superfamily protein n=1 Tax=Roseibium limicola TaxID=2816037 RepID=A0A939ELE9_9HYPH|nr:4'-phosphopantetheinyl transferase superfamily protein [Roseibium limicola]MBO0344295.1 4'-phosphopantetheinyl transferase superfamily protein [Roseibium limicola]
MTLTENRAADRFLLHGPVANGKPLITSERVALWWLDLAEIGEGDWGRLASLLNEEERSRSERFHFERDKQVYVAAHASCRGLLTYCTGHAPQSWQFAAEDYGKPELVCPPDGPRLRINISHTRGLAAVALTVDRDIGVDVEWLQRSAPTEKLAESVFAARECEILAAVPDSQKIETFLSFWTLKEAYVKAIGKGLSQPLAAFSFDLETLRIHFDDTVRDDPENWWFERYRPGPDHLMALAVRHPDPVRLKIDATPAPLEYLRCLAAI